MSLFSGIVGCDVSSCGSLNSLHLSCLSPSVVYSVNTFELLQCTRGTKMNAECSSTLPLIERDTDMLLKTYR